MTIMALVFGAVFERLDHAGQSVGPASYAIALLAGFVAFLSPCVLPLVPGYLSMVTGLDVATLSSDVAGNRRRVVVTTAMFVGGFGLVYVPFGVAAGSLGGFLRTHQHQLTRASGVMVLMFAAFMLASVVAKAPWMYKEMRFHPRLGPLGKAAPVVLGAAFAFGWTPCTGPVMGSILTIGANGRAWTGGTLLATYTLGLGIPFLVTGLLFGRAARLFGVLRRHGRAITIISALVLAGFGWLLITDQLATLNSHLSNFLDDHGLGGLGNWS